MVVLGGTAGGCCRVFSECLQFLYVSRQQGSSVPGGRPVFVAWHLIGGSSQCGYFCWVGFCAPILLTTPSSAPCSIPSNALLFTGNCLCP